MCMMVKRNFFVLFVLSIAIVTGVFFSNRTFATSVNGNSNSNASKYEQMLELASGDSVYIKDYDEYEDLMSEFDENKVNKIEFIKQLIEDLEEIEKTTEIPLFEAKVLSISEPEMQYTQDQSTAEYAMGLYQNGQVEILDEGELEGVKLTYMTCLTYDVYGNITLPEVKVGDIVNVTLMQIDDETVIAFSPEPDTYVKRFPTLIIISVIILFFVIGFLGKHSIKLLIPALLMIDIIFGVVGPLILEGFSLWLLAAFTILLNTIAICVLKLGVNAKSFAAIFTTLIVSFVMIVVHAVVDGLLNFSGITTESFLMSSGVSPNIIANEVVNIFNFHSLSILISLLIMLVLVVFTACKIVEKFAESDGKLELNELVNDDVKSYISEISLVGILVLIANALPKFMLLLVKSYTTEYVIQSEIFLIEFVRMLMMLVAVLLTVPVAWLLSKFLEE